MKRPGLRLILPILVVAACAWGSYFHTSALPWTRPADLKIEHRRAGPRWSYDIFMGEDACTWNEKHPVDLAKEFSFAISREDLDELWRGLRAHRFDRIFLGSDGSPSEEAVTVTYGGSRIEVDGRSSPVAHYWKEDWQAILTALNEIELREWKKQAIQVRTQLGPGLTGRFVELLLDDRVAFDSLSYAPACPDVKFSDVTVEMIPGKSRVAVRALRSFDPALAPGAQLAEDVMTGTRCWDCGTGGLRVDLRNGAIVFDELPAGAGPPSGSERLAGFSRTLADEHDAFGRALDAAGMHGGAVRQFDAALRRDPEDAEARARLGQRKTDHGWEPDPDQTVERTDAALDADALKPFATREACVQQRARAVFLALAEEGLKAQNKDEAANCDRMVLEYAPEEATSRTRLGFQFGAGGWFQPMEASLRKQFKDALEKAAGADATPYFTLEGTAALPDQLTAAMATRTMFRRLFEVTDGEPDFPAPLRLVMLGSQEEWDQYVEKAYPEENWAYAKTSVGAQLNYGDHPNLTGKMGEANDAWKKDSTVHMTAHALLYYLAGKKDLPLWLSEGIAYVLQFYLLGTAEVYCIPDKPQAEQPAWEHAPPEAWRTMLRRAAIEGTSPGLDQIVGVSAESMTTAARIKTFSFVDFLLARKRAELLEFVANLRSGKATDAAMKDAFRGATVADLDRAWRDYVMEAY